MGLFELLSYLTLKLRSRGFPKRFRRYQIAIRFFRGTRAEDNLISYFYESKKAWLGGPCGGGLLACDWLMRKKLSLHWLKGTPTPHIAHRLWKFTLEEIGALGLFIFASFSSAIVCGRVKRISFFWTSFSSFCCFDSGAAGAGWASFWTRGSLCQRLRFNFSFRTALRARSRLSTFWKENSSYVIQFKTPGLLEPLTWDTFKVCKRHLFSKPPGNQISST